MPRVTPAGWTSLRRSPSSRKSPRRLPPLLKQLAQQRDLLAVLAGRFPSQGPAERVRAGQPATATGIAREPSLATRRPAAGRAPGRGEPSRRQRPGWHRRRQPPAEYYAERRCRDDGLGGRPDVFQRQRLLDFGRGGDPAHFPRRSFVAQGTGRQGSLYAGRRTIPGHGPDRLSKCRRHFDCAPAGCQWPERGRGCARRRQGQPWIWPRNNFSPATPAISRS